MFPVEAMVPPSGLQAFRKWLVIHTHIHICILARLRISYRRKGGHVHLAAWDLNLTVFSSFYSCGVSDWRANASPLTWSYHVSVLCCHNKNSSAVSWFIQQDLYCLIYPYLCCLIDGRGKALHAFGGAPGAWGLRIKSVLCCASHLFFCLQERLAK